MNNCKDSCEKSLANLISQYIDILNSSGVGSQEEKDFYLLHEHDFPEFPRLAERAKIERLKYEPISYKAIFGDKISEEVMSLDTQNLEGRCNLEIGEKLKEFSIYIGRSYIEFDRFYRALVNIIKEINREVGLGEEFISIIGEFEEYDLLLDSRSRDHLIHQFNVFVLGYHIINKSKELKSYLKTYLESQEDDVIRCWFLASVFHDIGYKIEKSSEWLEDLTKYYASIFLTTEIETSELFPHTFTWETIFKRKNYGLLMHKLIESIGAKLSVKEKNDLKYSNLFRKTYDLLFTHQDHGVVGALIILNRLEVIGKFNKNIGLESAISIAMHSHRMWQILDNINKHSLSFENFPFAFLLMFCDTVSEWGRPSMKSRLRKKTDEKEKAKGLLKELIVSDREIKCVLEYSDGLSEIKKPQEYWVSRNICFSIMYSSGDSVTKTIFKK